MALKEWGSNFPISLDSYANMPTIDNGDTGLPSQINKARNAILGLQVDVGSDSLEAGSLKKRVADLESAPAPVTDLDAYAPKTLLDAYAPSALLDAYAQKTLLDAYATINTGELYVYADGTSGDDNNDGITALTPKKTFAAAWAAIPEIIDGTVALLCSGTFAENHQWSYLNKTITASGWFVISGEGDETVLEGPRTSTGSTTTTVTDSTASWTTDQHAGAWTRFTSGAQSGTKVLIISNTSDTLTFFTPIGAAGTGVTFEIVRPKTQFSNGFAINIGGGKQNGYPYMTLQNIHVVGNLTVRGGGIGMDLLNVMVDSGSIFLYDVGELYTWDGAYGFPDLINDFDSTYYCGVSVASSTFTPSFNIHRTDYMSIGGGFSKRGVGIFDSTIGNIGEVGGNPTSSPKFRTVGRSIVSSCKIYDGLSAAGNSSGAYIPSSATDGLGIVMERDTTDSAGPGLIIVDSSISFQHGSVIDNYTGHGIEIKGSYVRLSSSYGFGSPISGTNGTTAGAGVYAHSNSFITLENGETPTITGAVGNLSFDGTTQASTWAAIDGGTPVTSLVEMSSAKEV